MSLWGFGVRAGSSVLAGALRRWKAGAGSGAAVSRVATSSGGGGAGLAEGPWPTCACVLCLSGALRLA